MYHELHLSELQHRIAAFEDQLAYEELFYRYARRLQQFAYSICHHREAAEEIVLDVFMRVWMKRKTLDHIQNLKLYLYIATRNHSLNYNRGEQRFSSMQLDELVTEPASLLPDPDELLRSAELNQQIQEAIGQLPAQCKVIFKLAKEDGLKHKEIAELLHIQPKTVENQLAIALKKLATVLGTLQRKRGSTPARHER